MVSLSVDGKWLSSRSGCGEEKLLEALPQIKAEVESNAGGVLSLEVTADRPDLLSREGLARALRGFLGKEKGLPKLTVEKRGGKEGGLVVESEETVEAVRPVIVCALAKGLRLGDADVAELMQVQEKLTLTHGRRRRKVAIGIHDAAPIRFPLTYKGAKPNEVSFVPLNESRRMTLKQVLEGTEKGREYAFTLAGAERYPVILDASGEVVSFPPILNGSLTTVTEKTNSLFLDVTGTDYEACNVALNILCQNYSDDGARIYGVEVRQPWGSRKKIFCPEHEPEKMLLNAEKCNRTLGTKMSAKEIIDCLRKQRMDAKPGGGNKIAVLVPRYRGDFLHEVDLIEEVAIGFGYNAFGPSAPTVFTKGELSAETLLVQKARDCLSGAGFIESSTYVLTSEEKNSRAENEDKLVRIKNPVSNDYSALRASLLPSLLEILSENTHNPYPQKIFEVGEVVKREHDAETRTRTETRVALLSAHAQTGLSEAASAAALLGAALGKRVGFEKKSSRQFIEGRCAEVVADGERVGAVGEVSPRLLERWGIEMPVAGFEILLKK